MSTTGNSGMRRVVLTVLVIGVGAVGGYAVGLDRFFGDKAPAGPEIRGAGGASGASGSGSDVEPGGENGDRDALAADEVVVDESPGAWRDAQQAFLDGNAAREGVSVTPSGLQYRVLNQSGGTDKPHATDIVQVHYRGQLIDGVEFDSSYNYGEPLEFPLNEVIPGWTEGVQLMSVGDIYEFTIPSELGYGARGAGDEIPGHSVLIFEVELLDIIRP